MKRLAERDLDKADIALVLSFQLLFIGIHWYTILHTDRDQLKPKVNQYRQYVLYVGIPFLAIRIRWWRHVK